MENQTYDLIIIGGGPSGLTSAIYASRAHLNTLVIAGQPSGGQLMWTTDVENYPGFPEGIMGPDLIKNFKEQAERFGAEFVEENVKEVKGSAAQGFTVTSVDGKDYSGKALVVATGASAKWLNLESEQKLRGRGVSACATCDGFFFKEKTVAVVGAGDAAMEEANFLTKFSPKVYVLVRNDQESMRASKIMQKRAMDNEKIEFLYNTQVVEVLGDDAVTGLRVLNNKTNQESILDDVQGLFVAIGHKPNTDFLEGFVELEKGYVKVTDNTKSSKEGVFVGGDVSDYRYRQAITAAGLGCMAALDAEKYLSEHGVETSPGSSW